ncbi:MAG: hypothetical protein ABL880_00990 [Methylotenera sp.]
MKKLLNYRVRILLILSLTFTGCKFTSAIVDEVIEAEKIHSNSNTVEIDKVINKHIPIGMNIKSALEKLDEQGFEITEHDATGYREYPAGKLRHYADEEVVARVKKRLGDSKFEYYAKRFQIAQLLSSAVEIAIKSDGEKVLDVKANVNKY